MLLRILGPLVVLEHRRRARLRALADRRRPGRADGRRWSRCSASGSTWCRSTRRCSSSSPSSPGCTCSPGWCPRSSSPPSAGTGTTGRPAARAGPADRRPRARRVVAGALAAALILPAAAGLARRAARVPPRGPSEPAAVATRIRSPRVRATSRCCPRPSCTCTSRAPWSRSWRSPSPPATASRLRYADLDELRRAYAFSDLQSFLDLYYELTAVLQRPEDFADLADAYLARAAAQGVRHAEVFFDPQAHTSRGRAARGGHGGPGRGVRPAPERHGLSARLIACFLRDRDPAEAEDLLPRLLPVPRPGHRRRPGQRRGRPSAGAVRAGLRAGRRRGAAPGRARGGGGAARVRLGGARPAGRGARRPRRAQPGGPGARGPAARGAGAADRLPAVEPGAARRRPAGGPPAAPRCSTPGCWRPSTPTTPPTSAATCTTT